MSELETYPVLFVCLFVWVEALRPSQQSFSNVGTEPPLPGYYQYFCGRNISCVLIINIMKAREVPQ